MSATIRKHISKFLELQQHELQQASARGKSDGSKDSLHSSGSDYTGYMQEVVNGAKGLWSNYISALKQSQSEMAQRRSEAEYAVNTSIPDEISNLEQDKIQRQSLFESKEGSQSAEYEKIEEDLRLAKIDYDKIRAELNRPLATKFERAYLPFLIVLAFAEVPINRSAFELYFSGAPAVILALALAVGAMLVFFAHSIGHLIKENTQGYNSNRLQSVLGIGSIVVVTSILMYFLTIMRQSYTSVVKGGETFDDIFSDTTKFEVFQDSLFQPLNSDGIGLLVLNFSIYFAGILASFFRHDAHPHYEKIQRNYDKLRAKMASKREKIEKQMNLIQKEHNDKLSALANRRQNLARDVEQLSEELRQLDDMRSNDEVTFSNNLNALLIAYQNGYKETASGKSAPKSFARSHIKFLKETLND